MKDRRKELRGRARQYEGGDGDQEVRVGWRGRGDLVEEGRVGMRGRGGGGDKGVVRGGEWRGKVDGYGWKRGRGKKRGR
jgi:hypothetical protein